MKNLYQKYEECFNIGNSICDIFFKKAWPVKFDVEDTYKVVNWFLFSRATTTFQALVILCKEGYGASAAILSRTLLEILITILYIKIKPKRAVLYNNYIHIIRKDFLNIAFDNKDQSCLKNILENKEKQKIIEDSYSSVKSDYPNPHSWAGVTIKKMAKDVEMEKEYNMIYSQLSELAHPSVGSFFNLLEKDKNYGYPFLYIGPSDHYIQGALLSGIDTILRVLDEINKIFEMKWDLEIDKIIKNYNKLSV